MAATTPACPDPEIIPGGPSAVVAACSRERSGDVSVDLEEGDVLRLDFTKLSIIEGVVPCAVQDADTNEVILVAYVNHQALEAARRLGRAVFWSTSRDELWEKGATSGAAFELVEVRVNCEQNSLLYRVRPLVEGICHTRNQAGAARNCFYRRVDLETGRLEKLDP